MSIIHLQMDIKRAVAPILILSLLLEQDMYGYQIAQELSIRSDDAITMKECSIYGILYRLEVQKLISSEKVLVGKRRCRTYYHLEDKGKEHLQQLLKEYFFLQEGIMKILNFGRHSPDH